MEDTDDTGAYDLVLGGTGDLGRRLVERLEDPVAVSRSGAGADGMDAEVIRADVTADVPVDMSAVDTVYHLATLNSYGHPADPEDSPDVAGTRELVDAIEAVPEDERPELVYVSSAAAIDPPGAEEGIGYGEAKARGEQIAAGVGAAIVRPGSVYGDGKGVVSYFLDRAAEDEPLTVYGDGTQTRPFVHAEDAVDAILDAPVEGDVEVAEGQYSLNEVAGMIDDRTGVGWEYEEAETGSIELSGEMDGYDTGRALEGYIEEMC